MQITNVPLILPAAGKSSRLGSPKGLKELYGQKWFEIQCTAFQQAGGQAVFLVLGYHRDAYLDALGATAERLPVTLSIKGCQVTVLHNPQPELGPFSSLQAACRLIVKHESSPAAFYLPIDTPAPSSEVFEMLVKALEPGVHAVEPRLGGAGGHPVLIDRKFIQDILTLQVDHPQSRLDLLMRNARAKGEVAAVAVDDERVIMNLNDAEAWELYSNVVINR